MKTISDDGKVSNYSVEGSFCGGCPNLSWAKTGYGGKKSAKKSSRKSSKPKKRTSSKPKPKAKRTSSKPKPKAKRASSKKKVVRRKKGGAKTEQEVETDTLASLPAVMWAAQYGYPAVKALANRLGSQKIFRMGENDLIKYRQQLAQEQQQALSQENKTIYDVNGKSRYSNTNGDDAADDADDAADAAEADEGAASAAEGAEAAASVGEDLASAAEDVLVAFGKSRKPRAKRSSSKKKVVKRTSSKRKPVAKRTSSKKKVTKRASSKGGATKKKVVKRTSSKKKTATKKKVVRKPAKKSLIKKKKGGNAFGKFFETIWNGMKDAVQWEQHGNSKPGVIVAGPRSAPAPAPPLPHYNTAMFYGGVKREKPRDFQVAEREQKGAKKRYDDELKGYLADYKLQILSSNPVDMKNKEHVKRLNTIVAEEKANIVEKTKRLLLEAEANVFTEMFNQIRNQRPQFDKFNPV